MAIAPHPHDHNPPVRHAQTGPERAFISGLDGFPTGSLVTGAVDKSSFRGNKQLAFRAFENIVEMKIIFTADDQRARGPGCSTILGLDRQPEGPRRQAVLGRA